MTSKHRGPKRFTPTTIILIIALLGAVVGASRLVTPPPALPPEQPKQSSTPPAPNRDDIAKRTRDTQERMHEEMEANKRTIASHPVADPNAIEIDNKFFLKTKPGSEGLKQTEEQVKKQTAEFEAYKRRLNANKKDGTPPIGAPRPEKFAPTK